jgi:hypothetical protein
MHTIYIHFVKDLPMLAEVEDLPGPQDTLITVKNPRQRDGKAVSYVLDEVNQVILLLHNIAFIEIMPSAEDEEVFKPFRD